MEKDDNKEEPRQRRPGLFSVQPPILEATSPAHRKVSDTAREAITEYKKIERRHSIADTPRKHSTFFKSIPQTAATRVLLKELTVNILLQSPDTTELKALKETEVKTAWSDLAKVKKAGISKFTEKYLFTDHDPLRKTCLEQIELLVWCAMEYYKVGEGITGKTATEGGSSGTLRNVYEDILSGFISQNHVLLKEKKAWVLTQFKTRFAIHPLKDYFLNCVAYFIDHIAPGVYAEEKEVPYADFAQQKKLMKALKPRAIVISSHKERYQQYHALPRSHSMGQISRALTATQIDDTAGDTLSPARPSISRVYHSSRSSTNHSAGPYESDSEDGEQDSAMLAATPEGSPPFQGKR